VVFLFYTGFIPALNITQLPVQWVLVVLFLHLVSKLKQHGDVPPFPTCFHTVSFDILHNVPDHLPISYPPFRYALTLRPSSYFRLIHHISVTSASFVLIKLSRLLEAHNMNYYASSNIDWSPFKNNLQAIEWIGTKRLQILKHPSTKCFWVTEFVYTYVAYIREPCWLLGIPETRCEIFIVCVFIYLLPCLKFL
jgi:hypothetical protein